MWHSFFLMLSAKGCFLHLFLRSAFRHWRAVDETHSCRSSICPGHLLHILLLLACAWCFHTGAFIVSFPSKNARATAWVYTTKGMAAQFKSLVLFHWWRFCGQSLRDCFKLSPRRCHEKPHVPHTGFLVCYLGWSVNILICNQQLKHLPIWSIKKQL